MSKSLIKLIDAALIPAAVMICGKVVGLWFANALFDLEWGILADPNDFFSVKIVYGSLAEQFIATSYSNLIMYLFVFLGFLFILVKALHFHASHISPSMIAKLATNNLLNLMTNSFEIYYKASVWLVILWLAFSAILINSLLEKAYAWTAVLVFTSTILATLTLLRDVAREISIAKGNLPKLAQANLSTSNS